MGRSFTALQDRWRLHLEANHGVRCSRRSCREARISHRHHRRQPVSNPQTDGARFVSNVGIEHFNGAIVGSSWQHGLRPLDKCCGFGYGTRIIVAVHLSPQCNTVIRCEQIESMGRLSRTLFTPNSFETYAACGWVSIEMAVDYWRHYSLQIIGAVGAVACRPEAGRITCPSHSPICTLPRH